MKKVAFYTNMPSPYRIDFFNELGKYCELYVFFEMDKSKTRNNSWQSYNFKNFKGVFLKGKTYSGEAAYCPGIIKKYKEINPEINFVCNFSSLTGIKLVNYFIKHKVPYYVEGDGAFNRKDTNPIKKIIKNRTFINASKLFYTSTEHLNYLLSHKADLKNTVKYPFSSVFQKEICDAEQISALKEVYKKKIGIINMFTIISVGRFLKLKNFEILIKALKHFEGCAQLLLVGGRPLKEYEKIIKVNNIKNIKFIDFLSKEKLFDYYKASDLFVFTSRCDVWGLVVNEAMANCLPIICSKGALAGRELSKNNNGIILYESENLEELENAIQNAMTKSNLLEMAKANQQKIKEYTIESMCDAHICFVK